MEEEAERIVAAVEAEVTRENKHALPPIKGKPLNITVRHHTPWKEIWNAMVHTHGRRSLLGLSLMIAQAFFYNAIFFTYALLLIKFYNVPGSVAAPTSIREDPTR